MRVLALHRVPEVRFDPFDADFLIGDAARAGVLGRHKGLDEEVGDGGEEKDGHLCLFCWLRGRISDLLEACQGKGKESKAKQGKARRLPGDGMCVEKPRAYGWAW